MPNEILCNIYDHLEARDIPSFAASCQSVQVCISGRLGIHRNKVAKYGRLWIDQRISSSPSMRSSQSYQFVFEALQDVKVGDYLVHLTLGLYDSHKSWLRRLLKHNASSHMKLKAEATFALVSKRLYDIGYREETINDVDNDILAPKTSAILQLVLLFAPNLQSITFAPWFWTDDNVISCLEVLERMHLAKIRSGSHALDKLEAVDLGPRMNLGQDGGLEFQFLSAFATLPAMRTLRASNFRDAGTFFDRHLWRELRRGSSFITELILTKCVVDIDSMIACLRSIGQLKTFALTTDSWRHGRHDVATWLVNGLETYHGDYLERLHLSGDEKHVNTGDICCGLNLHKLEKLKIVRVDQALVLGTKVHPNVPKSSTPQGMRRLRPTTKGGVIQLDQIFPQSTESINLDSYQWLEGRAGDVFRRVANEKTKAKKLPNLTELKLRKTCLIETRCSKQEEVRLEKAQQLCRSKAGIHACIVRQVGGGHELN